MRSALLSRRRRLALEPLEARRLLAAMPLGALPEDTAEYMLGRVAVTPVFFESDGTIDPSTEDWSPAEAGEVLAKIEAGLDWWVDALAAQQSVHSLEFVIDTTHALDPVETVYEPISRPSNDYSLYADEFLRGQGYASGGLEQRAREFNHAQRTAHDADWAFTMFVVDSENDLDGSFAPGGSFSRAFAFAGGLFMVAPSTRPASTFAHETGHMFWARDEYPGGGSWTDQRGYYNTQNVNAWDNPTDGFEQQPSIMAAGEALNVAWQNHVTAASTLAMVGWQDSDGDGIFDVLDVPLELDASARHDAARGEIRLSGSAEAVPLANRNPSGLQSDITLNRISRIEYQLDDGPWQTAARPDRQRVELDLTIPVNESFDIARFRAVDSATGITSETIEVEARQSARRVDAGLAGHLWWDRDGDGVWEEGEVPVAGAEMRLLDADGNPLDLSTALSAEEFPEEQALPQEGVDGVRLLAEGVSNSRVGAVAVDGASAGAKAFGYFERFRWETEWGGPQGIALRAAFDDPTTVVHVDVEGTGASYGRLEAFDSQGKLIARATSDALAAGQKQTLAVADPEGRIAAVKVRGHSGSSFRIDRVEYGPQINATTDAFGAFAFDHLPDQSYVLEATRVPAGLRWEAGAATATVADGRADSTGIGLEAAGPLWTNPALPADVNGDARIQPVDALLVINALNRGGIRDLDPDEAGPPYYDVDGNGRLEPRDALLVINRLNGIGRGEAEAAAPPRGTVDRDAAVERDAAPDKAAAATGEAEGPLGLEQAILEMAREQERRRAEVPPFEPPGDSDRGGGARDAADDLAEFFLEPFPAQPF